MTLKLFTSLNTYVIYKDSIRSSRGTGRASIRKSSHLLMYNIIAVYPGNHTKHINTLRWQNVDIFRFERHGT